MLVAAAVAADALTSTGDSQEGQCQERALSTCLQSRKVNQFDKTPLVLHNLMLGKAVVVKHNQGKLPVCNWHCSTCDCRR
jgi:hypothetical protein